LFAKRPKKIIEEETIEEPEPIDVTKHAPALIIHGASSTKIGFGGEKYPRFVYPEQSIELQTRIRRFPLDGSRTTNEELLKAYWDASIKQLKVDLAKNPILISLPTADLTVCPFRDMAQEYFYELNELANIAVVSDPFLSLVGFQPQIHKLTAIVVDIGFSQIRIVPFYQSAILEEHITQVSFGGFELTLQLATWLQKQGYEGPIDALFIRDIKENYCYVKQTKHILDDVNDKKISYYIDKQIFELQDERWKLPELFFFRKFFSSKVIQAPRSNFEGSKFDMKNLSLSVAIANVIKSLNFRLWSTMCKNICLTGGGTKFIGLKERLEDELKELLPDYSKDIKIHTTLEPALMPYIGASKLAMLSSFQKYWRSNEDYTTGEYEIFL
jgi:actin-related protein